MRFGLWITHIMIGCATLIGCADSKQKCGNKVLALWPVQTGGYTFREIQLTTLLDPYKLSGGAAKVYFESGLDGNGLEGPEAQPRYTRSGDTCVPMDTASSMAVSVYAQFESLMKFETRLGVIDMLSWPRRVGVDIHVSSSDGSSHNNAHYFSGGDSIAVLPYNINGVPLALNQGVMAHEHFHGHFQRQVIQETDAQLNSPFSVESLFYSAFAGKRTSVDEVDKGDLSTPRGLNAFVLRAWNEGLADLYGAIYSGNPRFFDESLPHLKEQRALTASLFPLMSAASLKSGAEKMGNPRYLVALSYDQGAYLARLMYKLAHSGVETPEQFLVRVLRKLRDIPAVIVPIYDTQVIEFEEVVAILLRDFPRTGVVCENLRKTVSKELMNRSFKQCSEL